MNLQSKKVIPLRLQGATMSKKNKSKFKCINVVVVKLNRPGS